MHADISGIVVDATDDNPLSSALVSIQATETELRTNENGAFFLAGEARTNLVLVAAQKGFFKASSVASDNDPDIRIALDRFPEDQDPDYVFRSPEDCSGCHFVQFMAWETSPMAYPYWSWRPRPLYFAREIIESCRTGRS